MRPCAPSPLDATLRTGRSRMRRLADRRRPRHGRVPRGRMLPTPPGRAQVALVAVARKLAVLAGHLLSDDTDYRWASATLTTDKLRQVERKAGQPIQRLPRSPVGSQTSRERIHARVTGGSASLRGPGAEVGAPAQEQRRFSGADRAARLGLHLSVELADPLVGVAGQDLLQVPEQAGLLDRGDLAAAGAVVHGVDQAVD